jgi:hypothetical protein
MGYCHPFLALLILGSLAAQILYTIYRLTLIEFQGFS